MNLAVPDVNRAPRGSMSKVGHFVDDVGYDGFAHYLPLYRAGLAELPPFAAQFDLPTTFGSVRAYRFDGPAEGKPVVLLHGRYASTPMWRTNLPALIAERTVYSVDLLGEPGLSVQQKPIRNAEDQARWLDEALAGLNLEGAHLLGVSIGGWSAANYAVRRPGRAASIALLDPVMTFDRLPLRTVLAAGAASSPGVPDAGRKRFLKWVAGGADDDSLPETALIAAGMIDFVLRLGLPKRISAEDLQHLQIPVLAIVAGRSVMLRADRATGTARKLLAHGHVELWPDASHGIVGEYPAEINERTNAFWGELD